MKMEPDLKQIYLNKIDLKQILYMYIIKMDNWIFKISTQRYNLRSSIARDLRKGKITIKDIRMPENTVWTGTSFITEKLAKKKIKNRSLTPDRLVTRNKIYNQLTGRFLEKTAKNIAKVKTDNDTFETKKILDNVVKLKPTEQLKVNFNNIGNHYRFLTYFLTGGRAGRYVMRLPNGQLYTLSQETIAEVLRLFKDETESYEPNSKTEILELLRANEEVIIERLPEKRRKPAGAFFPYFHKMPRVDLTDFDIYTDFENGKDNLDENCLLVALRNSQVSEAVLNQAKVLFRSGCIPKSKLDQIGKKLKVCFKVRSDTRAKDIEIHPKGSKDKIIDLALMCGHYFIIKDTPYTKFAIEHYDEIDEKEERFWGDAYDYQSKEKGTFKYSSKRPRINSWKLVSLMLSEPDKYLNDLSNEISSVETTPYYSKIKEITCLDFQPPVPVFNKAGEIKSYDGDVAPTIYKRRRSQKIADIIFYDVETCKKTIDKDLMKEDEQFNTLWTKNPTAEIHQLYQLCYSSKNEEQIHTINETEGAGHAPKKLLNKLTKKHGKTEEEIIEESDAIFSSVQDWKKEAPKIIMYAHNGGYDLRFIRKYLWNFTLIQNGNSLIVGTAYYRDGNKWICLEFRDTYKLISKPLAGFADMFKLNVEKEYMPYDLYTEENVWGFTMPLNEVLKTIPDNKKRAFLSCAEKAEYAIETDFDGVKQFDLINYSAYYCKRDVDVMKQGFEIFSGWVEEALGIDVLKFYTIPSIAHEYFMSQGCYDEVYEVRGVVREFINKALVGGRTMLCDNEKQNTFDKYSHKKIADFDAVSLYPSAMKAMKGFLKGSPKVIQEGDDWKNCSGYFVELKITDIKKHRHFPMMSFIDPKKGTRNFSDIASDYKGKTIVVDKIMLELWEEYHQVEFEFIRGYSFNEGHNTQIRETIEHIFNTRLEAKNAGNPIQEIWKLVMNSGYGKSITKAHDTKDYYVPEDKYTEHIARYYNWVKQAEPIVSAGKKMWCIKQIDSIGEHGNYAHIGIEILSQSKKIMADVMYLAEDNNIQMYITDTDSIHMNLEDVEPLGKLFTEKYDRDLIGKGMGQFHTDFDLKGCKDVYSKQLIALGKKCYIDHLVGTSKITGEEETGYHIRMKGVSEKAIRRVAKDNYDNDLMKLYQDLYDGKAVDFDLTKGVDGDNNHIDLPAFEYHKSWIISNKKSFIRKIKF